MKEFQPNFGFVFMNPMGLKFIYHNIISSSDKKVLYQMYSKYHKNGPGSVNPSSTAIVKMIMLGVLILFRYRFDPIILT